MASSDTAAMVGRTQLRRNASVQNEVHDFSTFHSATHSAVKLVVAARVVCATDAEAVAMAERTRRGMTISLARAKNFGA